MYINYEVSNEKFNEICEKIFPTTGKQKNLVNFFQTLKDRI